MSKHVPRNTEERLAAALPRINVVPEPPREDETPLNPVLEETRAEADEELYQRCGVTAPVMVAVDPSGDRVVAVEPRLAGTEPPTHVFAPVEVPAPDQVTNPGALLSSDTAVHSVADVLRIVADRRSGTDKKPDIHERPTEKNPVIPDGDGDK